MLLAAVLINLTPVQNFLIQRATSILSNKLQTTVSIEHVSLKFLNTVALKGVYIADQAGDTLLSAGTLEGSITDWFIFKDRNEIHYIGLEDAVVKLKREINGSRWNYSFIAEAFTNPNKSDSKASMPNLDIEKVSLKNVSFLKEDPHFGNDMQIYIGQFSLQGEDIDLPNKKIWIDDIDINKFIFNIKKYAGTYIRNPNRVYTIDTSAFNPEHWSIKVRNFSLTASTFSTTNDLSPIRMNQFDGQHISVNNIIIQASNIDIQQDTLIASLNKLTALERSGIEIKNLSAQVKISPKITELKDMYLQTNKSVLRNYYAMHYNRFPDYEDFITKVTMQANFTNSHIAMEDIAYFAPSLLRWRDRVYHGGFNGYGTVDKLDISKINLTDGKTTLKGEYKMYGLPDINTTSLALHNGEIITSYADLKLLFPEIAKLNIQHFETINQIHFKGNIEGFYNRLTVDGNFQTNIGNIQTTQLALDYSLPGTFKYEGQLASNDLNVNSLFPKNKLGNINFDLKLKGDGFNYQTNNIHIAGALHHIDYNYYRYEDITLDANFNKGKILALVKSYDPYANFDLQASITNAQDIPNYNIDGIIQHIDLYKMGFSEQALTAKGNVKANFLGNNFKNFEGEAEFSNLLFIKDNDSITYNNFSLSSHRNGLQNTVEIKAEGLKVFVDGTYYLDELINSTQAFLAYYLPEFILTPTINNSPNQVFNFSIQAEKPDALISLFTPKLKISNGIDIQGKMNGVAHELSLSGTIPFLQYNNISARNITISSMASPENIAFTLDAYNFSSADKEMMSSINFKSNLANNHLDFQIQTNSKNTFGTARITGDALARNDSLHLQLQASEFFFNENKWDIAEGNKAIFAKNFIDIHNLLISSDAQKISINTPSLQHAPGELKALLQQINIRPILEMLNMEEIPLEGNVSGEVQIADFYKSPEANFNVKSNTLFTSNQKLGSLHLIGNYNTNLATLTLQSPSGMYDSTGKILLTGTMNTDNEKRSSVDFYARADNASLKWAEPFAITLIRDLTGILDGELYVKGQFPKPDITGFALISNGTFIPQITGVQYTLPQTRIDISASQFRIQESSIYDSDNNKGTLSGSIAHQSFANLNFALRMYSENIKVLNLKANEGENFYGNVNAQVTLTLRGLLTDMNMNITAKPTKNSKLFIPLNFGTDVTSYNYISFKKKEDVDSIKAIAKPVKKSRLSINIDALATTDLETEIIMDPTTDEVISGKGTGSINLYIPAEGDMRMNGAYMIEEGFYDFTFKQLQFMVYKERFLINSGSTITWDGEISKANVDVKANTKVRARLYELIQNDVENNLIVLEEGDAELQDARLPQNINVDMNMTGQILSPELKFKLSLEESRSVGTYAYQKLQRINSDENVLLNQVVFLLLIDQFVPPEGINAAIAVGNEGSKLTEMLSNFASGQATTILNKLLNTDKVVVNMKYRNYNLSNSGMGGVNFYNWNEAGFSVQQKLFDDRLVLDIGGIYNWGNNTAGRAADNIAGDFRLQYLLSPEGGLRLNIFRTTSFDPINLQNFGRHGVGLSYRKNFNNLQDFTIFKRNNNKLKFEDIKEGIPENEIPQKADFNTIDTINTVDSIQDIVLE